VGRGTGALELWTCSILRSENQIVCVCVCDCMIVCVIVCVCDCVCHIEARDLLRCGALWLGELSNDR
jgi:hypothetical protein